MNNENQTISDCWEQFVRDHGVANIPPCELRELRRAFHAGAVSVFLVLEAIPDEAPEGIATFYIATLQNELADMGEAIAEGRA